MSKVFMIKGLFRSFLVSFLILFPLARPGHCVEISKEKVIEIASQFAKTLDYDPKKMTIEVDESNTAWKEHVAFLKKTPGHVERKVKDKKYWAVYFAPIPPSDPNIVQMGGDLWVFVDANTGEVLTYWKGV